jgi:two-component system OmpR family response regulator
MRTSLSERTVLLVDRDAAEAAALSERLREVGYGVDIVTDLGPAIAQAVAIPYSIVLTELDLPGGGGTELIRQLQERLGENAPPVLVVTHNVGEIDRVVAFEVGAADYLARPYFFRELLARMRARERRGPPPRPERVSSGDLVVDLVGGQASVAGEPLPLTPTERALLAAILARGGAVVTRATLMREVWNSDQDSRTLDTHLRRLRAKLEKRGPVLETVRGVGVRLARTARAPGRTTTRAESRK